MKKKKGLRVLSLAKRKASATDGSEGKNGGHVLLVDADAISPHEREIELDRLEVKDLEVDVAGARRSLGFRNPCRLVRKFAGGGHGDGSVERHKWTSRKRCARRGFHLARRSRELGEVEEGKQEVLVDLDRHLLKENRRVLEVGHAMGYNRQSVNLR